MPHDPAANMMKSIHARTRIAGFTLLEMMIGLMLTGLILTAAYALLFTVIKDWQHFHTRSGQLSKLSDSMLRLQRDGESALDRQVRISVTENQPHFWLDEDALGFHLTIQPAQPGEGVNPPERIHYHIRDGALIRSRWAYPDRLPATPVSDSTLLENLSDARLSYPKTDATWEAYTEETVRLIHTTSQKGMTALPDHLLPIAYPPAIRLDFTHRHFGPVSIIVPLPVNRYHVTRITS